MSENASSVIGVIPQIFYDIIARFIPGIIIILGWVITYLRPSTALKNLLNPPNEALFMNFWYFLFFIILAYINSIILFGICILISIVSNKINGIFKHKSKETLLFSTDKNLNFKNPSEALMYDFIRFRSGTAGARLVKLRAEHHMSQIIIVGTIIAMGINIYLYVLDLNKERLLMEIFLILIVVGMWSFMVHVKDRFIVNMKNHWLILNKEDN